MAEPKVPRTYDHTKYRQATNEREVRPGFFYVQEQQKIPVNLHDFIGEGAFGEVFWATMGEQDMAVKIVANRIIGKDIPEIDFLRRCQGSLYIVQLIGYTTLGKKLAIETELMGKSLSDVVEGQGALPMDRILRYARQLLSGVAFLHSQNLLHCDIKENNALTWLNDENRIKIVDFGLTREKAFFDNLNQPAREGIVCQRAPEALLGLRLGLGIDLWAVACVVGHLYMGRYVFDVHNEAELLRVFSKWLLLPEGATSTPWFSQHYAKMDTLSSDTMHTSISLNDHLTKGGNREQFEMTHTDELFVKRLQAYFHPNPEKRPKAELVEARNFPYM